MLYGMLGIVPPLKFIEAPHLRTTALEPLIGHLALLFRKLWPKSHFFA